MSLTEEELKGKIFNKWEILRFSHKVGYAKYFVCKCLDCNEERTVYIQSVTSRKSKSCGCISRVETAYNINKKYNKYEVIGDVVRVFVNNDSNKIMLCDIDDWEKLKEYYWRESATGYANAMINYKNNRFHRMIFDLSDPKIQVDHVNGDILDNRKENLRLCSNQNNSFNRGKNSNNTSGYKGVHFDKDRNKWRASIMHNGKNISSPRRYNTPEEAYEWYVEKSNDIFGEFSVFESREIV